MCLALSTYGRHDARVPDGTCILVATEALCYTSRCLIIVPSSLPIWGSSLDALLA